jgi:hypothetical protein
MASSIVTTPITAPSSTTGRARSSVVRIRRAATSWSSVGDSTSTSRSAIDATGASSRSRSRSRSETMPTKWPLSTTGMRYTASTSGSQRRTRSSASPTDSSASSWRNRGVIIRPTLSGGWCELAGVLSLLGREFVQPRVRRVGLGQHPGPLVGRHHGQQRGSALRSELFEQAGLVVRVEVAEGSAGVSPSSPTAGSGARRGIHRGQFVMDRESAVPLHRGEALSSWRRPVRHDAAPSGAITL